MGNRNGRCWNQPASGRKEVLILNFRKWPRLGHHNRDGGSDR